ncbi:MAG: winged helix-turn-helix transcriptional regulator [Spirochaetes bacterium]|nr:winged helix-turn-helix transcriptional regulator [Spirochaetota bacterium]
MNDGDRHIYRILTAAHLLKNHLVRSFRESGVRITPSHSAMLFMLEEDGPLSPSALGEMLRLDNSTVTGLVDRLEAAGFVRRDADPDDRRRWSISITPEGRKETAKALTVIKAVNARIGEGFTNAEMRVLHAILEEFGEKFI